MLIHVTYVYAFWRSAFHITHLIVAQAVPALYYEFRPIAERRPALVQQVYQGRALDRAR